MAIKDSKLERLPTTPFFLDSQINFEKGANLFFVFFQL
jgi:hypothetical protein